MNWAAMEAHREKWREGEGVLSQSDFVWFHSGWYLYPPPEVSWIGDWQTRWLSSSSVFVGLECC